MFVESGSPEPADSRSRLVAAAADVFRERGYDGATVADVARRAGLTTGAIYSNFRGKADLLATAILEHSLVPLDETITSAGERPLGEALRELGRDLVAEEYPAETLLLDALAAGQRDPQMAEWLRAEYAAREQLVCRLVTLAREMGIVRPEISPEALVRYLTILSTGGLVLRHVGLDPPDADDWTALVDLIVDALL